MSFNLSFLSVEENNSVFVKNKVVLKSTVNLDFVTTYIKILDIFPIECANLNFISLQAGSYI